MASPTPNEEVLADRIVDALALLKGNGADKQEQEYYVAETMADYRRAILPVGDRNNAKANAYIPPFEKHWRHAEKLIKRGEVAKARAYVKANIKKCQVLPSSRLVIRVMLALLDKEDDAVSWATDG